MLKRLCGPEAELGERIELGRNSRVYTVLSAGRPEFVAKVYAKPQPGQADRLHAEFNGLHFLWRYGVRDIPEPFASDPSFPVGVYRWVEGWPVSSDTVTAADVDSACGFLGRIAALREAPGANTLPPAAEACFSLAGVLANVRARLRRFDGMAAISAEHAHCASFLAGELSPFLDKVEALALAGAHSAMIEPDREIPLSLRTLSPSDFGFHNTLRRPDGSLVFLDFEYFGWDDPAKLIADTLSHPALSLPEGLKTRFYSRVLDALPGAERLRAAVPLVYPVFRIKWCLIILNEFLHAGLARRQHAGGAQEMAALLRAQLEKSRGMLSETMASYDRFPYR